MPTASFTAGGGPEAGTIIDSLLQIRKLSPSKLPGLGAGVTSRI